MGGVANYTEGILVLHEGRIVHERHFGCLDERGMHAAISMTTSLTGLLAQIMVVEGTLHEAAPVSEIIPEIGASTLGSATVRQAMDVTTGVRYSEDYSDRKADIWTYSAAASPLPKPKGHRGPGRILLLEVLVLGRRVLARRM